MGSAERRRVPSLRWHLLAVGATVALVLLMWSLDDLVLRTATLVAAATSLALVARRELRPPDPDDEYARALARAVGVRVQMSNARVVALHAQRVPALVTFTWRGAVTTLLDADCRPLAEHTGNGLTSFYTWSVRVHDDDVVARLASEQGLGTLSVYAVTDLTSCLDGNVRDNGYVVEQHEIAFPGWSASVPTQRDALSWDG